MPLSHSQYAEADFACTQAAGQAERVVRGQCGVGRDDLLEELLADVCEVLLCLLCLLRIPHLHLGWIQLFFFSSGI